MSNTAETILDLINQPSKSSDSLTARQILITDIDDLLHEVFVKGFIEFERQMDSEKRQLEREIAELEAELEAD